MDRARKGVDDAQNSVRQSQEEVRQGESGLKEAQATQKYEQSKYDDAVGIAKHAHAQWDAAVARHDKPDWVEQAYQSYLSSYSTARADDATARDAESKAELAAYHLKSEKADLARREKWLSEAQADLAKAEKALSDAKAGSKDAKPCAQKKTPKPSNKKTQAPRKPSIKTCPKGTGLAGKVNDIACQDTL